MIPGRYQLTELDSSKYWKRTYENVQSSDGSLIIYVERIVCGTLLTEKYCQKESKPYFEINLLEDLKQTQVNFNHWVKENHIITLNIAGPRESEIPIYDRSFSLLNKLLSKFQT